MRGGGRGGREEKRHTGEPNLMMKWERLDGRASNLLDKHEHPGHLHLPGDTLPRLGEIELLADIERKSWINLLVGHTLAVSLVGGGTFGLWTRLPIVVVVGLREWTSHGRNGPGAAMVLGGEVGR